MNIYHCLQEMQQDLWTGDWTQMDRNYHQLCAQMATPNEAKRIHAIDLNACQHELKKGLFHALGIAGRHSAKAVYFEYDLDNDWRSHFFVCRTYHPMKAQDDDWACDWSHQVEGPALTAFADIYAENGFDGTEQAIGITCYLVAKTVIAFSRPCREISVRFLSAWVFMIKIPSCGPAKRSCHPPDDPRFPAPASASARIASRACLRSA